MATVNFRLRTLIELYGVPNDGGLEQRLGLLTAEQAGVAGAKLCLASGSPENFELRDWLAKSKTLTGAPTLEATATTRDDSPSVEFRIDGHPWFFDPSAACDLGLKLMHAAKA